MTNKTKRRVLIITGIFAFIIGVLLDLSLAKAEPSESVIVLLKLLIFIFIGWSILQGVRIYIREEIKRELKD